MERMSHKLADSDAEQIAGAAKLINDALRLVDLPTHAGLINYPDLKEQLRETLRNSLAVLKCRQYVLVEEGQEPRSL